ncbi:MAG: hypothetical protein OEX22_08845 [Cyclobacteriaceae bacterium]|nr:hypothetical protein [Cyclobacteriaceae bacterium]
MSLENRYKIYLIVALILCVIGIVLNISSQSTTGLGGIFISSGGISLVLGITIKRKSQDIKKTTKENFSSQEE